MKPIALRTLRAVALAATLLLVAGASSAVTINLIANMDGAQVPTASAGTGTGIITFDTVSNLLSWNISWSGLTGTPTLMHFHGPALPGVNAGVVVGVGVAGGSPVIGSATITDPQEAELLAGLWYLNLHTTTSPGGEIRGQVTVIPEPTALLLVGGGLVALGTLRLRRV